MHAIFGDFFPLFNSTGTFALLKLFKHFPLNSYIIKKLVTKYILIAIFSYVTAFALQVSPFQVNVLF